MGIYRNVIPAVIPIPAQKRGIFPSFGAKEELYCFLENFIDKTLRLLCESLLNDLFLHTRSKDRAYDVKNKITMNTITDTNFNFPNQKSVYHGKVREVYNIHEELLVMVATDRLSAFDVVMPKGIPYIGQILHQLATKFLELTKDSLPNWLIATSKPKIEWV